MATTVSLVNMKGGVGKTTITFNLSWYCAWQANMKVLAVDLDPQANLSQYFMGAEVYRNYIDNNSGTIVDIFEQFSAPIQRGGHRRSVEPDHIVHHLHTWRDGSLLDLIPSRLELAWTLKNPTDKAELLPHFLGRVREQYDLIIIDCAPTESILTTAAYRASEYIVVPVRPEFLATIGLPLLARSLDEFSRMPLGRDIEMAGIVFNGKRRHDPPSEQITSCQQVERLASRQGWPVFDNPVYHSDSYPKGSRGSTPIFRTDYARRYVVSEFNASGDEFLRRVGLR